MTELLFLLILYECFVNTLPLLLLVILTPTHYVKQSSTWTHLNLCSPMVCCWRREFGWFFHLFQVPVLSLDPKPPSVICSRHLNTLSLLRSLSVFISSCMNIVYSIASVTYKKSKTSYLQWLNGEIRQAEHKCKKKNKRSDSPASLKDLMFTCHVHQRTKRLLFFTADG